MPDPQQTGSICAPFRTISQALAVAGARPVGSGAAIEVEPGLYDEELVIPGQRMIGIRSFNVELGTSATPRSVTWTDGPSRGGLLLEGVHVTGDVLVAGVGGVTGSNLMLVGPQDVEGKIDGTGYAGALSIECSASFSPGSGNIGEINAPTAFLSSVERNNFFGPVSIGSYGRIVGAEFSGPITVAVGAEPTEPSAGFYRCFFLPQGITFTGPPASEFRVDGVTNFAFKNSLGIVVGAAKVIIEDLTP